MRSRRRMQGPGPVNIGGTGRVRKPAVRKHGMSVRKKRMTQKQMTGKEGEDMALEYLLQRGYRLLERNWRCGHKEIDLILEHADGLHIVEVKTRREPVAEEPHIAVDVVKQHHLEAAAASYMKLCGYGGNLHFDIMSIVLDRDGAPTRMIFMKDAFYPLKAWT